MKENRQYRLDYNLQWFAKDGPGGEKTEPATAKKLKDARQEGQVAKSKELSAAFDLIALFVVLKIFISFVGTNMMGSFQEIYEKIPDVVNSSAGGLKTNMVVYLFNEAITMIMKLVAPFFAIGVLIVLVIGIAQVGWKPTAKPMKPKGSKLNPLSGFKRILSKESLFELVKSLLKIGLIIYVAYVSIRDQQHVLLLLYDIPLMDVIMLTGTVVLDTGLRISVVYLVIGLMDFIYQRHKFKEDMKMTKQEVKDEFKNTEGNPEIKGRQRAKMREVSQRRMMQNLPTADVVITNPTHLSVAIKYDAEQNKAPVVIAKGADYLAMQIREKAKEHGIELVENKPLARMLYANVDVGAEIPPELYQAVAEVLAFVYSLRQ